MLIKANLTDTLKVPRLRFPGFFGEWEEKKLSDFLKNKIRKVPKPSGRYKAIGIRSHFKGTFQKPDSDPKKIAMDELFRVEEDDFIVNITFAWEGALAIVKKEDTGGLVSHRFPTYIFDKNISRQKYFRYVFPTKRMKHTLGIISPGGAGRNRVLDKNDFLKIKINLPPLLEQQKISEFLESVDEWIENLETQKKSLELYKKGIMQKIFSQEIRFKDDKGNEFPKWKEKKLEEIAKTYNGLTGKSAEDFGEGSSFITYKQIFDKSEIDVEKCAMVKVEINEEQNRAQFGDIFFTTSSETPHEVGFSSVLLNKNVSPYLNSFSFGIRSNSLDELNPYFAKFLFRNSIFRKEVVKLAQGSTRYNISKIGFMRIKILLPSLSEQQKIAEFLTSIDKVIESKEQQITLAESWKIGLMQRMFI